jgi:flavin reductase (DIM6/NTAB) family NADH-FMN oxidoreductase RutF
MAIGPEEFRRALGHFASGVTVVTTRDADGRPIGLTASAFTSVSLTPPLILICVDHQAQSYDALKAQDRFAVSILTADQEPLSRHFASTQARKFDRVAFERGVSGLPLLSGALAHLECRTVHAYPGGDHTIFVAEVEVARVGSGEPLLHYRGRYDRLRSGGRET